MKYKHEFAIEHLPKFIIGSILTFAACMAFGTLIYNYMSGNTTSANVIFFFGGIILTIISGLMLSDGIEYTKTEQTDPPSPTDSWGQRAKNERKKFISAWDNKKIPTIEERREEIIAMDFSEDIAQIEQEQEKQELTTNVLDK